jgi:hypothetical protein
VPDTVILAINDGNQDIGTYESLKHAEREDVDPQAEHSNNKSYKAGSRLDWQAGG